MNIANMIFICFILIIYLGLWSITEFDIRLLEKRVTHLEHVEHTTNYDRGF